MAINRPASTIFFCLVLLCCQEKDLLAASSVAPERWSQTTVSPSLLLPKGPSLLVPVEPLTKEVKVESSGSSVKDQALIKLPAESAIDPLLTVEDQLSVEEPGSAEENGEESLSVLDPESMEEAKILSEEEVVPPEDEGLTTEVTGIPFDFPVVVNQKVQYYIDYFTGPGRAVFSRWLERSTRYLPYMQEVFVAQGLPRDLTYLSIVESGLNPRALSRSYASGPWQFISGTGKMYGLESDYWWDERRDFEKSTLAAALYLKELYSLFNGNWYLAVASYNAGPGAVSRAVERSGLTDFWSLAHSGYLPEETKNYIPKLLAVLQIAKEPEMYGFSELQFLEPVACDKVTVEGPVDLTVVARLADVSYEEIKALNPELKRWCTPPKMESYELKLPLGTQETFLSEYGNLSAKERFDFKLYKVGKKDSLKELARQYKLSSDEILRVNSLASAKDVKPGRSILLPLRSGVEAIPREDLFEDPVPGKIATKTYKVKKGDTLTLIAKRSGASLEQLKSWNRLSHKSRLRVGQTLIVGAKGKKSGVSIAETARTPSNKAHSQRAGKTVNSSGSKIVYTVQRGDTVYKIARQYALTPSQVLSWNGLGDDHILQPGQNLTLRVQSRKGG